MAEAMGDTGVVPERISVSPPVMPIYAVLFELDQGHVRFRQCRRDMLQHIILGRRLEHARYRRLDFRCSFNKVKGTTMPAVRNATIVAPAKNSSTLAPANERTVAIDLPFDLISSRQSPSPWRIYSHGFKPRQSNDNVRMRTNLWLPKTFLLDKMVGGIGIEPMTPRV